MKLLLIILLALFGNTILYTQVEEEELYLDNEFTIQIQNAVNRTIVFEMMPIGANWAKIEYTTDCGILLKNDDETYISSLYGGSLGYVDCAYNGFEYRFFYEGNYTDINGWCAQSTAGLKPIRNGFYRVNIKENNVLKAYAYFDWRDLGFPTNCNTCLEGNDFTIRYDAQDEKILFWNSHNIPITITIPDITLSNGQIINWADWQCNERVFTPFWSNGLVLIPDGSNHPKIIWGPYEEDYTSTQGYYVFRALNNSYTPPPLNQFVVVDTLNSTQYDWTDYDFLVGGPTKAHYYVKAILVPAKGGSSPTSSPTNVVTTSVGLYKNIESGLKPIQTFSLDQNYPNPFNPATKIYYTIRDVGLVSLKVFDILGREVAMLVNDVKEPGYHSVDFNASDLPSGIYIYTLQVNDYNQSRKMILLR